MAHRTQPDTPPRTLGLNHVNLVVADVERSVEFYRRGLGLELDKVTDEITFLTTPGIGDSLALQLAGGPLDLVSGKTRTPGDSGGVDHIGFDVPDAATLNTLVAATVAAGGTEIMRTSEDDTPTAFIADPDGYLIQLTARYAGAVCSTA
jgi:catechol 2,3-dioxygenase-like lactoylglutathione lyase family enzyme